MIQTLKVVFASYHQHTFRSLLVFLALLMAVAGLSSVLILNETAKQSYQNTTQPMVAGVHYRVSAKASHQLSKDDYTRLRKLGFFQLVPVVIKRIEAHIDGSEDNNFVFTLYGVDSFALLNLKYTEPGQKQTGSPGFDRLFDGSDTLLIHTQFAKESGLYHGQSLLTKENILLPPLTLVNQSNLGREIVADIATVQKALNTQAISELWLAGEISQLEMDRLEESLPQHLKMEASFSQQDAQQLEDSFHLNILAMAMLMFVVCLFVVMNALNLLLSQRIENFKVLRQLGVHRQSIFLAVSIELALLCLITTPLGFYLGIVAAKILSPAVSSTLENLYGAHITFAETEMAEILALCFASSFAGAFFAAIYPLKNFNRRLSSKIGMDIRVANQFTPHWFTFALLCALLALGILLAFKGLISSFVIIALLLVSGCALMTALVPLILRFTVNHVSPSRYLVRYCLANALLVSNRSKIAFCAFFIAVSANVGMNLMVDSFRQATNGWLEQRLNAPAYIFSDAPQQLAQWQKKHFSDLQLVPRMQRSGHIFGQHNVMFYFRPAGERFEQAIVFEQTLQNHWQLFNQQKAVFVNQQLFYAKELSLGEKIPISFDGNQTESVIIAGVTLDYGNPKHQVMLAQTFLPPKERNGRVFAVFDADESLLSQLKSSLEQSEFDSSMITTKDLLGLSMETFDHTFVITDSLGIVTLLVAAFSLASSMIIFNLDDKPKQALMRSLGISRQLLLGTNLSQYCGLVSLVCLVAIPFGLILSWLLINLVNLQAFHWRYPLIIEPIVLLKVLLTSVVVVSVSLLFPLLKTANQRLNEDIKWLN